MIVDDTMTDRLPTVIVGAGTVGLFLAHELIQRGQKVILIEAGNDTIQSFKQNEYSSIGHAHNGVSIGRAKGIGGTSNLWGGQLAEFREADIDQKGAFGQPSWPLSWEELHKYYPATYKKLGFSTIEPPQTEKLLMDAHDEILEIFYTRWMKQPNFKYHFQKDLMSSDLLTFYRDTVVTNLKFENEKCISIEVNRNGLPEAVKGFSRVILANGTIEICRLLLISKKSENCPYKVNPWIGRYLQDHLNMVVGRIIGPSKTIFGRFANIIRNGEKLQPKIRMSTLKSNGKYIGISGFFAFESNVSHHLDNVKQFGKSLLGMSQQRVGVTGTLKMIWKLMQAMPQIIMIIYYYLKKNRIYVPFSSTITLTLQAQQISNVKSSITLSDGEMDDLRRPKAVVNWQIDGREFGEISNFCSAIDRYLMINGLGKLKLEKWFSQERVRQDGSWLNQVSDVYHQAGGTIMSESSDSGVVDKNLRMHNSSNIYVCGASVLPTSGYANTTLTVLALTLRLADHLIIGVE